MLSWLRPREQDVYTLIQRKDYSKAAALLERQVESKPDSVHLRQQLADVSERMGDRSRAIEILESLAAEFAAQGAAARTIAILKKIRRIDPTRSDVERQLAALGGRQEGFCFDGPSPLFRPKTAGDRYDRRFAFGTSSLSY